MKQDPFEQLLRRADGAAHVPSTPPQELADGARQHLRRQRRLRTALGSCACVATILIVLSAARIRWTPAEQENSAPEMQIATSNKNADSPEELQRRILQLSAEADRLVGLARAARRMSLTASSIDSKTPRYSSHARPNRLQIPASFVIEQEVEVTARVMIEQASRWQENPKHREKAIRYYHRTIKLFPTTAAANTAKDRLAQLEQQTGAKT